MSILKSVSTAATAAAMIMTPVAASAAPAAQSLSVMPARTSVEGQDESQGSGAFIGVVAAVLIILGIVLLAANDDDEPASS